MLNDDERYAVRELALAQSEPLGDDADLMDCFWHNYGIDQASQNLPWGSDQARANYLNELAWRYERLYCQGERRERVVELFRTLYYEDEDD